MSYACKYKVPELGVAVYDDTNFQLYAARDVGSEQARGCFGDYMFDDDDITPVTAEEVCDILGMPFLFDALSRTLACTEGEEMAAAFESGTELPAFLDGETCREAGMEELCRLEGASILSARK